MCARCPDSCADTLSLLQAPARPPLASFVTALANDLDRLAEDPEPGAPQRFVLVLDDYQNVQGQEVHSLLGEILRHPPRSLHLIISTRQDPPIPLHALRARGELVEIRVREMRFTRPRSPQFMEQTLGTSTRRTSSEIRSRNGPRDGPPDSASPHWR